MAYCTLQLAPCVGVGDGVGVEVAVGDGVVVVVGVGVEPLPGRISIPFTLALSLTLVNWIRDLSTGVCRCRKCFDNRFVGRSSGRVDVKVAENLLPIQRDIEESLTTTGPVGVPTFLPVRRFSGSS